MTERTKLISYLFYGLFSVILKKNAIKTPEVIFHIRRWGAQEVIALILAMALFIAHTKYVFVC